MVCLVPKSLLLLDPTSTAQPTYWLPIQKYFPSHWLFLDEREWSLVEMNYHQL
jgi:hypothetical protein